MLLLSLQQILKKTKEILSKLDNERLAIAAVSLLGLCLLFFLIIASPELIQSEWFLNILTVIAEYSSFIAGGAYLGRLFNLFTARLFTENNKEKTKVSTLLNNEVVMGRLIKNQEKELTPIGMLLGIGLAIACIVLHATIPFLNVFSYVAYVLFILGYACAVGGLFNRLGSSMDGSRLPEEKGAILFGAIFGLVFALGLIGLLVVSGTLPLIPLAGISKVFLDLFLLNKTLFTFTFILSLTSLSTSFCDYFAKATCFLKFRFHLGKENEKLIECVKSRYHEYRGAFLGLISGSLLAFVIIMGLVATGGLSAAPIAIATTLFLTTITCGGVVSALFSRIGRVIDGVNRVSVPVSIEDKNTNKTLEVSLIEDDVSTNRIVNPLSANVNQPLIPNEQNVQVHYQENTSTLINQEDNLSTRSNKWQPQEQDYSSYLLEIHLGKRPFNIFKQKHLEIPSPTPKKDRYNLAFFQVKEDAETESPLLSKSLVDVKYN